MSSKKTNYTMTEKMAIWPTDVAPWHFLPIKKKIGIEIKEKISTKRSGFCTIPVEVTIGNTVWKTSLFPDKYSGSYILPVKAVVRKTEDIKAGDKVEFTIVLSA